MSIKTRLILLITALLITVVVAIGTYFAWKNRSHLTRQTEIQAEFMKSALAIRGQELARTIALASQRAIVVSDYLFLTEIATSTVKNESQILYVIIMDTSKRALVHTDKQLTLSLLQDPQTTVAAQMKETGVQEYKNNRAIPVLEAVAPIEVEGRRWGTVRIGLSLTELDARVVTLHKAVAEQIWEDLIVAGIAFLLVLLLAIGVAAVAAGRTIAPLHKLENTVKQIEKGILDVQVESGSNIPEINELATAINLMTAAISDRDASIREKIDRLDAEVHQRRAAQTQISELKNYLGSLIDSMPSIVIGVDETGCVTHWNQQAVNVLGRSVEEAVGRDIEEVLQPFRDSISRLRSAIIHRENHTFEKLQVTIGDTSRFASLSVYPLNSETMKGAVLRIDDVTERVRLEQMMVQSEKMLSVGGLAAGMAHEINNPLAGIMQSIQVMQNRVNPDMKKNQEVALNVGIDLSKMFMYLELRGLIQTMKSALESGRRASEIVQNMLSFSRKSSQKFTLCTIEDLLEKSLDLASNDYDLKKNYDFRKIRIVREYATGTSPIWCEQGSIQQVILNLLKNGAQAMAELLPRPGYEPRFTIRTQVAQGGVKFEISDNGPGIESDHLKKIFEPFFTTKEVNEGTGLGLSVSYFIIVENHQGQMSVQSSPGEGATFSIVLPHAPPGHQEDSRNAIIILDDGEEPS